MPRQKTSPIWLIEKHELINIIQQSSSMRQVLIHFGLPHIGNNGRTLRRRCDADGIEIPKWKSCSWLDKKPRPLEELLVLGSTYSRGHLKNRLIKGGLLQEICAICNLSNVWNNKKLSLVLDHVNGIRDDNRLENLRLLCPNCNSQTPTFAGRSLRKIRNCIDCQAVIAKGSKRCKSCSASLLKYKHRKVKNRPPKEMLLLEISQIGYAATGRRYGVSDNTIRKWLKNSV